MVYSCQRNRDLTETKMDLIVMGLLSIGALISLLLVAKI